ncbi:hypothetical protein [Carboxylicivirga sp. M1479]|uniref:hypothetical protein n=1 Tax=Carboxylicivirga sp. M1479 TaxID=2594476 RepID=UPI00117852A9|nr:hypothetical protein [Carboxylicivirga sp. M1479]TRX70867.1 hypothetical protein FNN09_09395 [Carboxylicivirga sp. M1479]
MAKSKTRKKKPAIAPVSKTEAIKPFVNRLNELCDMLGCDVMQHFSTYKEILRMARWRFRIGNITDINSEYSNSNYKTKYSKIIKNIAKSPIHKVEGITEYISLVDFTYLCALTNFLERDPNQPEQAQVYLQQLNNRFSPDKLSAYVNQCIVQASFTKNLPDQSLCAFDAKIISVHQSSSFYIGELLFTMRIIRPQKEHIVINKQKRLIYQVFIPCGGKSTDLVRSRLKTSALKPFYKGDKKELLIYIQSHAIRRFQERTLPIHPIISNYGFNTSLLSIDKPIVKNKKLYLPYHINNVKAGYFVAEIVDDKVLIKTFIIASHATAPEGRKFQELTGLHKMDMNYWDITMLNTFIYNTMTSDNPLYPYFEESGLLPLFQLNEDLSFIDSPSKDVNWQSFSQCIQKHNRHNTLSNTELESIDFANALS